MGREKEQWMEEGHQPIKRNKKFRERSKGMCGKSSKDNKQIEGLKKKRKRRMY